MNITINRLDQNVPDPIESRRGKATSDTSSGY